MDGDQIDLILKAIDDSQKEMMEKINEQLKDYATADKLDQALADIDILNRKVQNLERGQNVLNEKTEENGQKIEANRKITTRNTNDIEQLKMQLKNGLKEIQN